MDSGGGALCDGLGVGSSVAVVNVGKVHVDDNGMNLPHEGGIQFVPGSDPMANANDVRSNEVQTSSGRVVGLVVAPFVSSGSEAFLDILVCRVAFHFVERNAHGTFGAQEGVQETL